MAALARHFRHTAAITAGLLLLTLLAATFQSRPTKLGGRSVTSRRLRGNDEGTSKEPDDDNDSPSFAEENDDDEEAEEESDDSEEAEEIKQMTEAPDDDDDNATDSSPLLDDDDENIDHAATQEYSSDTVLNVSPSSSIGSHDEASKEPDEDNDISPNVAEESDNDEEAEEERGDSEEAEEINMTEALDDDDDNVTESLPLLDEDGGIDDVDDDEGIDDTESHGSLLNANDTERRLRNLQEGLNNLMRSCGKKKASSYPRGRCKKFQVKWEGYCYDVYKTNEPVANLPIVISAPHDGRRSFNGGDWAQRGKEKCGRRRKKTCLTGTDTNSAQIALRVAQQIIKIHGNNKYPHLLVACISRKNVDFNRRASEAAFGKKLSKEAHKRYFKKVDQIVKRIQAKFGRGLWLDFHGWQPKHGSEPFTQLGYGIARSSIENSTKKEQDYQKNPKSTIRALAKVLDECGLVKGGSSLGATLTKKLKRFYSPALPSPGVLPNRLQGDDRYLQARTDGFTVSHVANKGPHVAAIQVEMPATVRCKVGNSFDCKKARDNPTQTTKAEWNRYAKPLAQGIHDFMKKNYGPNYASTFKEKQLKYMLKRNKITCARRRR